MAVLINNCFVCHGSVLPNENIHLINHLLELVFTHLEWSWMSTGKLLDCLAYVIMEHSQVLGWHHPNPPFQHSVWQETWVLVVKCIHYCNSFCIMSWQQELIIQSQTFALTTMPHTHCTHAVYVLCSGMKRKDLSSHQLTILQIKWSQNHRKYSKSRLDKNIYKKGKPNLNT